MRNGKATRSWRFQRWGDTGRKCEDPGQPCDVVSVSRWTWERVPWASHPLLGHLGIPMRHFVTSFLPRWQQTTSSSPCEPPYYSQAHSRCQFVFSSCVCKVWCGHSLCICICTCMGKRLCVCAHVHVESQSSFHRSSSTTLDPYFVRQGLYWTWIIN